MALKNVLFLIIFSSETTLLNLSPSPTYFIPFLIDKIVISLYPTASNLCVFFDSTLFFIPHIIAIKNLKMFIYLELENTKINYLISY